jgi:hypothetical protein
MDTDKNIGTVTDTMLFIPHALVVICCVLLTSGQPARWLVKATVKAGLLLPHSDSGSMTGNTSLLPPPSYHYVGSVAWYMCRGATFSGI